MYHLNDQELAKINGQANDIKLILINKSEHSADIAVFQQKSNVVGSSLSSSPIKHEHKVSATDPQAFERLQMIHMIF